MARLVAVLCFALVPSIFAEDVIDALATDDQCDGSESCALNALQAQAVRTNPVLTEEVNSEEELDDESEEFVNRHLEDAKRELEKALRKTKHMMGEMDKGQVVRLLERSIRETRDVHKCNSRMHEARMHMKDAKTELNSRGSKANNKRMAENHMEKARKKMSSCMGMLLLQDEEQMQDVAETEADVSDEESDDESEEFVNRHLQDAKRDLEKALRKTKHMMGEMDKGQVVRLLERSIRETRDVHKCNSRMHEARMHMKDAKTELNSRGSKANNKRMAENHMEKARQKMSSCMGTMLLQDEAQMQDVDEAEADVSEEELDDASEEWVNRHLEDAKRDLEKALRKTKHMMGEMDKGQVVRLLERSIKETRDVHKCNSRMHEARMHMKDAKTELNSRGSKANNKRMAENHMEKARKKMSSCMGMMLLQDEQTETLAKLFDTSDEETFCNIRQQGTDCQKDADCQHAFSCCQDTVAKKIGVKPCKECTKTCHPDSHKCKCN